MKSILISNKNWKTYQILEEDNIHSGSELLENVLLKEENKKYNKLINKNEKENKKIIPVNLINEEIENQHNKFQKNLIMKKTMIKKEKIINENKLIQSIQNVFINEKNEKAIKNKLNSPNKNEQNSNKENISNNIINSFSYSNNQSNNTNKQENNLKINLIINKKNNSEFEPLTPENLSKFNQSDNKSSIKKDCKYNIEDINETNDFSLNNEKNTTENNNKFQKDKSLLKNNILCSDETKDSNNINCSNISNSSPITNNLNDSTFNNNNFKNFRLDFNDLFELMKDSHILNNKQQIICKDIKLIIDNYIKEYNQYINENLFTKFVKKFSDLWDEMFKKYTNISDIYDKELKKIDEKIDDLINDELKLKELENISQNLKNEKENEITRCEENFSSEIESTSLDFNKNYSNIDKGLLLLNEKFALIISKKIFDMINNNV